MADITREDLRTILAFGLHVAKVDHDFAGLEKNVLRHYVELIHLSEDEKAQFGGQPVSLARSLEHLSSDAARVLLVKTICSVAFSDGVRHENETAFIEKVNQQLGNPVALPPWEEWGEYEAEVLETLKELG